MEPIKSSKNWIFVPKFNFDKTLFFDLFEFLRQSWKMFIYKSIKNLNFRAKNLDFEPKLGLQNIKNNNFNQFWPIFWHFEFKIFQIGCKKIKSRIWTKIGLKKYEKKKSPISMWKFNFFCILNSKSSLKLVKKKWIFFSMLKNHSQNVVKLGDKRDWIERKQ